MGIMSRPPAPGTQLGVVAALFLVAANQRAPLSGLPPLLSQIEAETGISATAAGLLTSIPTVTMGLFAPAVPGAAVRIGVERALAVGLGAIVAGSLLRLVDPPLATLIVGGILIGAGITTIGTLLPGVLTARFGAGVGRFTGITTLALALGATLASALAVPLADALGWRGSLAFWALPAALAIVAWLPVARPITVATNRARMPVRSVTAWNVVLYTTMGTVGFFSCLAWVAPTFEGSGWSAASAGLALSGLMVGNMIGAFVGPSAGQRFNDRRPILAVTVLIAVLGLLGLALLSAVDLSGWSGVAALVPGMVPVIAGAGLGAAFSLSLYLLADVAADAGASRGLSALTFLVAFLVASPFPMLLGYLYDFAGSYAPGWILVAVLVGSALLGVRRLGPSVRGTVA